MTAPTLQGLDSNALRQQLLAVVLQGESQRPRNLQTKLGPSGLGDPCTLSLAYGLLEHPHANPDSDPLPSIVGTGAHAKFAEYFETCTETLPDGRRRYLVEQRVTPRRDIPGSADLFDRLDGTVIDWKFQGKTKLDNLKRHGPGLRYRVQAHTYGLGFENAGEDVRHVAIVGVPRGGFLSGTVVWTEPYDRQIALDALDRLDRTLELALMLRVLDDAENWMLIPRAPSSGCIYCPWFSPGLAKPGPNGCPGHVPPGPPTQPTPDAFLGSGR